MSIVKLMQGDCIEEMKKLEDESIDAVITDPPAGIAFMGKSWDKDKGGRDKWIAWLQEIMEECNRVLKPGAHVVVWALPRTSHWTRMAIDNAGFEIRHIIDHIYSSGFPKSQNMGKAYDKKMGNERRKIANGKSGKTAMWQENGGMGDFSITKGNSQWEGFGTALKPAHEDWILARKPLSEKTIVENCIKHGTGALDIDGCRIPIKDAEKKEYDFNNNGMSRIKRGEGENLGQFDGGWKIDKTKRENNQGRFPADVVVSGDALNDGIVTKSGFMKKGHPYGLGDGQNVYGKLSGCTQNDTHADSGSKSRYFDIDVWAEKHGIVYCPKASKKEKNAGCDRLKEKDSMKWAGGSDKMQGLAGTYPDGTPRPKQNQKNHHPTCKPLKLMSWLIRLVSKNGDTVLDPFMGSGTTGVACNNLDRNFIGIELDEEYFMIAENRLKSASISSIMQ